MEINELAKEMIKAFPDEEMSELEYQNYLHNAIEQLLENRNVLKKDRPYYDKVSVNRIELMYIIQEYTPYGEQVRGYHTNLTCHKCNTRFQQNDMLALAVTYRAENQVLCQGCAKGLLALYPELSGKARIPDMEK